VWANQPRIVAYLGYNPFTDPAVGRPRGNETIGVAFLSQSGPLSLGQQIMKRRLEMRNGAQRTKADRQNTQNRYFAGRF